MAEDLTLTPPPLTLKIPSIDQTIKMTYGLEGDLRRMLPDIASAMQLILSDPFTQDYVIRRVLTPTKKMITNLDDLIPVEEVEITSEEQEEILQWALEHAMYFFMVRAGSIKKVGDKFKTALPDPSTAGSQD
jgi:hypothetical protein